MTQVFVCKFCKHDVVLNFSYQWIEGCSVPKEINAYYYCVNCGYRYSEMEVGNELKKTS